MPACYKGKKDTTTSISHSVNRKVEGEPTALNACELCSRSEKDRHELNASEFVIFVKKFWQPTVEKFASSGVSKA